EAGKARAGDGEAVGALEPRNGLADGFDQIAVQVGGNQLGDDFGVGFALEADAVAFELASEGGVVFDDAIMDDGDGAVATDMRMGIAFADTAVRGPARVADAARARRRLALEQTSQLGDAADCLADA